MPEAPRVTITLDAMYDLAVALQKKNPDLAWDDAQDQAYKQLTKK